MLSNESHVWERRETLEELVDVNRLAEKVAQRLAYETHGQSYDDSVEICLLLQRARSKAEYLLKSCDCVAAEQELAPLLWPTAAKASELPVFSLGSAALK